MYPPPPNMWGQGAAGMNVASPPPQQTVDPGPPNWFEHYDQNYAHLSLPNTAYDALRDKFFGDHIAPWAMQKGEAVGPLHTQFMKQTEREGTSENPRSHLIGTAALSSLLAPLKIVGGATEVAAIKAEEASNLAALEAARNGINPAWYQMLGEAGGQLPYWAAGMGIEGQVAGAASLGEAAHKALKIATGALIQGSYDAAKAPDGQRTTQGFHGAAVGGMLTGGFELAGPLWKFLKTGGLPEESAKAVERVAQGIASEEEHTLASSAMSSQPELEKKIQQWTTAQGAGAKSAGIPNSAEVGAPDGQLVLNIIGSDGKPYQNLPSTGVPMENLVSHLKAGGGIEALNGDPVEIQKFLKGVEESYSDAFKLEGVDGTLQANDTILMGPRDQGGYEKFWQSTTPTHEEGVTEYEKLWHDMDRTMQEGQGMELLGQPAQFGGEEPQIPRTRGKIKFRATTLREEDVPPSERTGRGVVDRPLSSHEILDTPEYAGATTETGPGEQPHIEVTDAAMGKEVVHHEMLHAHFNNLGMHGEVKRIGGSSVVDEIMMNAFSPKARGMYSHQDREEEVFAYTSGAIRDGNTERIQRFADADGGKESVLNWYTETANKIREHVATLPDSLHKRTLERRLSYTVAQASKQLEDVRQPFSQTHRLDFDSEGNLHFSEDLKTGVRQWAPSRETLLKILERETEPLNTPELVDTTNLPPIPRYAVDLDMHTTARAPITTDPPPPVQVGGLALSNFFRPFYDWVGTVGQKFGRMDLVQAFEGVRNAQIAKANLERGYVEVLEGLRSHGEKRQTDFYKHYEASTPEARQMVAEQARFSPEEQASLKQFESEFDGLPGFSEYIRKTVPEMRANKWDVETRFPRSLDESGDESDMIGPLMRKGRLDPRDQNLLRVASTYLNGHSFHQAVEPAVKVAESLVDEMGEDGSYTFDILRPLLKRQIQYYRGVPDWSQKVVMSAVESAVGTINKGIQSVNKHLPEGMQLPTMKDGPRDVLGKFILFNYAGALALRPAVPIRDTLSLFLTSYPILGEEYLWKGMSKAMSTIGHLEEDPYQIALKGGWLMSKNNLPEMIAAGGEQQGGKATEWTHKAMSVMTLSENSKRLSAGWGYYEKIKDALEGFSEHGDRRKFVSESGLWFLNPARREAHISEAATHTTDPTGAHDWLVKATKDMVDATNWDFSSGAAPGFYKYQLGRLFGQYGQWPMNYIEYARKFVSHMPSEYRSEAIQGLTRFGIANGAVLAAAHSVGIDAAQWTFSQPLAYGGGPLFNAVTQIPNTMDFQSYQGQQARREVIRPIWPGMVPGSNEMHNVWKAIADDDGSAWIRILGFVPTKEAKQ